MPSNSEPHLDPDRGGNDALVRQRMELLRREHPGEDNWIGYVHEDHEPGECIECDALRALEQEDINADRHSRGDR